MADLSGYTTDQLKGMLVNNQNRPQADLSGYSTEQLKGMLKTTQNSTPMMGDVGNIVPDSFYSTIPEFNRDEKIAGIPVGKLIPEKKDVPALIGGTVGSIGSMAIGQPELAPLLAGLGAMGAENLYQIWQQQTGDQYQPKTPEESVQRILSQGGTNFIGEYLGNKVGKTIEKGMNRVINLMGGETVTPEAKKAVTMMQDNGFKEIPTIAHITDNPNIDELYSMTKGSLIGGPSLAKNETKTVKNLESLVPQKEISPTQLGYDVGSAAKETVNKFKDKYTPLYESVLTQAKDQPVDIRPLKKMAENIKEISDQSIGVDSRLQGDTLVSDLVSKPDVVPYSVAHDMEKRLFSFKSNIAQEGYHSTGAERVSNNALDVIKEQIGKSLDEFDVVNGTELKKMWTQARAIRKSEGMIFDKPNIEKIRKLATNDPQNVAKNIFKSNDVVAVKEVRRAVGRKSDAWSQIQDWLEQDILSKSTNSKTNEIIGTDLISNVKGRTGYGKEMLTEALGSERTQKLIDVGNALRVAQSQGGSSVLIKILQAGSIAGVAAQPFLPEEARRTNMAQAGIFIGGPVIISKMMRSPRLINYFINGVKLSPESEQFTKILTRMASVAIEDKIPEIADNINKYLENRKTTGGTRQ